VTHAFYPANQLSRGPVAPAEAEKRCGCGGKGKMGSGFPKIKLLIAPFFAFHLPILSTKKAKVAAEITI
jgi:hypothetical protein